MTQRPNKPPDLNLDLEETAELPVKDLGAIADDLPADRTVQVRTLSLDDPMSATDVFSVYIPPDLQALTSNLQNVDERMRRKSERLAELQADLAAAREAAARDLAAAHESAALELAAARETAARDVAAAQAQAGRATALAEERAARIRDLEQQQAALAADVAQRRAVLEAEVAQLRQGLESEAAQRREALEAELAQQRQTLEAGLLQRRQDLETEAARARQDLEQARSRSQVKVGELELQVQGLRSQLQRQHELLGTAQTEHGVIHALLDDRDVEIDALRHALDDSGRNSESVLATLRAETGRRVEAAEAEVARMRADATAVGLQTAQAMAQRDARIAELEAQLAALRAELAEVQRRAAELDARAEDLSAAVAAADGDAESRAEAFLALEKRAATQADTVAELGDRLQAAEAAATEAGRLRSRVEEDLRVAEEQLHRVESDLRQRDARLGDLQGVAEPLRERVQKLEQWLRERDEEVERLASEAAARAAVLGNLQQSMQRLGSDESGKMPVLPPPDDAMRLMVRLDGPAEVVHVLGRRTTIGRTPDNALQVDAGYVSRHHAVVLVSEKHTVIEDLNSTNGVLVNGRRVTRSLLRDGDTVTIGKADFRFDVRGPAAGGAER